MPDLEDLRNAFPEQDPPTEQSTTAARRELELLIREAESRTRRREVAGAPALGERPKLAGGWMGVVWGGWVGSAVTAAAAVVMVVGLGVPLVRGGGTGVEAAPVTVTPVVPRLAGASQVLMAAAVREEVDEKVSGEFFRVRSLHVSATTRVGNPRYTLERRTIGESWMPRERGVQSWFGWVDLGYRPATPADAAKWRTQGAPRSWRLSYEEDPITTAPSEPVVRKMAFDEVPPGYYLTGDKPLTAQQIAALPTDPVKLRAVLARGADPGATATELNYTIFAAAGRLLFEMPSPPKLRGAALRVLAALPGTHVRTGVKDPIGRVGTEITIDTDLSRPSGSPTLRMDINPRYIIDPTTGRLLSSAIDGPKPGATVVLESGWTDEHPKPPSTALR